MSRIGKKPILIPENVEVKIEGQKVLIKGPKGELQLQIRPEIKVEIHPVKSSEAGISPKAKLFNRVKDNQILFSPKIQTKQTNAFWGLTRALVSNMVNGVIKEYEKKLEIQGVGFRAAIEEEDLVLQVGFSHPVKIKKQEGIKFSIEKNIIIVSGIDKQKVTQMAAVIRKKKPPEPYQGKGIRYVGEKVRRKQGKKAATTTE